MAEAEKSSWTATETEAGGRPPAAPAVAGRPALVEPDLTFIHTLSRRIGQNYKKCMQCGTCAATCSLSPDSASFPRKEVIWAAWGWKDRLVRDPDVWLCYQCNDCSTRCPRSAHPGDLLAAVRHESIIHFARPRFLARWVNDIRYIPLLLAIPALLLGLALRLRDPLAAALGITERADDRIVYAYSSHFPHWLINGLFLICAALVLVGAVFSVACFWRSMKAALERDVGATPVQGVWPSLVATLRNVFTHDNFSVCTTAHIRYLSHPFIFYGFLALTVVTLWVIAAGINPLIRGEFIYPFSFWSPWKILANLGGLSVFAGCVLTIRERLFGTAYNTAGNYYDWSFLVTLILVALTGFVTEVLHYFRMEPHRHVVYFVHLIFVFALLVYMPYSKFAHVIYRTTALVLAESFGRKRGAPPLAEAVAEEGGDAS
ncbi:quinone-interacting membrane-bound oxidoreductase complex subunit QmoC [bacterium]|nr:quinone-interacting membrane-bound oxidoreductase complex subunit QmoC [bacterium]MBU1675523.1 quinone-interacting membrane-bound oxidoreductase complex subunit QmoC [bacterium]